jgi:hypothetical protein
MIRIAPIIYRMSTILYFYVEAGMTETGYDKAVVFVVLAYEKLSTITTFDEGSFFSFAIEVS